jgi:hypothetical protein
MIDSESSGKAKPRLKVIQGKWKGGLKSKTGKPDLSVCCKDSSEAENLFCQLERLQKRSGILNLTKAMTLNELSEIIKADKLGLYDWSKGCDDDPE